MSGDVTRFHAHEILCFRCDHREIGYRAPHSRHQTDVWQSVAYNMTMATKGAGPEPLAAPGFDDTEWDNIAALLRSMGWQLYVT